MVWNNPPAKLCSFGSATCEMNNVPVAKTKSAPMTAKVAPGKPKAQYGALGMMTAYRRQAREEQNVPVADGTYISFILGTNKENGK